jgi:hypothetical protein
MVMLISVVQTQCPTSVYVVHRVTQKEIRWVDESYRLIELSLWKRFHMLAKCLAKLS